MQFSPVQWILQPSPSLWKGYFSWSCLSIQCYRSIPQAWTDTWLRFVLHGIWTKLPLQRFQYTVHITVQAWSQEKVGHACTFNQLEQKQAILLCCTEETGSQQLSLDSLCMLADQACTGKSLCHVAGRRECWETSRKPYPSNKGELVIQRQNCIQKYYEEGTNGNHPMVWKCFRRKGESTKNACVCCLKCLRKISFWHRRSL